VIEALSLAEEVSGRTAQTVYSDTTRLGDHKWYISDCAKLCSRYPSWTPRYDLRTIMEELVEATA